MAGRTEARIFTTVWKDGFFTAHTIEAQWLYFHLLSQDDLSYCGVMPLRQAKWARKAAGLTTADIERALKALEGTDYPTAYPDPESGPTPLVVVDYDTDELLIRSLLRRDGIWRQPNLLKLARESAESVDSRRICGVLLAELRRLPLHETGSDQVKTLVADFITDLEKGEPYPTAYPPPHPHDNPSADPSDLDYARAQGNGDRNGSSNTGSPNPLFPEPQTALPAQPDRKQGHRLPDDFALTPEMLTWAAAHAPHVDPHREFDQFCDYWRSKPGRDGRKLDWRLTWNNWMRTAESRQGPRDRSARRDADQAASDALFQRNMARETSRGAIAGELT